MSISLAQARREVAARAAEFLQGTATGGSTTSLVDTNELVHSDGYWEESVLLLTSGTNNDNQQRVKTFTSSTATLAFYGTATASVMSGDTFELYRRFAPLSDIKTAINRAINVGAPDFREKHRDVLTATFNTLQYDVPTMLMDKGLVAIEYQYYVDPTQADWPYQKVSPDLYEIVEKWDTSNNRVKKTLQLKFNPETNKLIRFVYDMPLGNVSTSTDLIHLDLPEMEWLYTQSVTELWRIEASRSADMNRDTALKELARWEVQADKLRRQLAPEQQPRPLRRTTFRTIPWAGSRGGW